LSSSGVKTLLRLRIVPNARRSEIVGAYGEAIKIKVQAPAVEGKANEALREFLAESLRVPLRCIELVAGEKSRDKSVAITGLSAEEVQSRLAVT
jgi:uncharacterized protein (TIGR00251 family)